MRKITNTYSNKKEKKENFFKKFLKKNKKLILIYSIIYVLLYFLINFNIYKQDLAKEQPDINYINAYKYEKLSTNINYYLNSHKNSLTTTNYIKSFDEKTILKKDYTDIRAELSKMGIQTIYINYGFIVNNEILFINIKDYLNVPQQKITQYLEELKLTNGTLLKQIDIDLENKNIVIVMTKENDLLTHVIEQIEKTNNLNNKELLKSFNQKVTYSNLLIKNLLPSLISYVSILILVLIFKTGFLRVLYFIPNFVKYFKTESIKFIKNPIKEQNKDKKDKKR